jgi:hypothetical protein
MLHTKSSVRMFLPPGSTCACSPAGEQVPEVNAVDGSISIQVASLRGGSRGCESPVREQDAEIDAIDHLIDEEIGDALAGVRHSVVVEIRSSSGDFTGITYAVLVAVGLQRIRDSWTVVVGVGAAVAVGIRVRWPSQSHGVAVPSGDHGACPEVRRDVALAVTVPAPGANSAIGAESDGMEDAGCDGRANSKIGGSVALTLRIPSPSPDYSVGTKGNGMAIAGRDTGARTKA